MAEATVWTVNKILQWTQQYFAGKGLESPRLDAEVLLCDVLGCRRIDLFMRLQQELTEEELHIYHDLVVRRGNLWLTLPDAKLFCSGILRSHPRF